MTKPTKPKHNKGRDINVFEHLEDLLEIVSSVIGLIAPLLALLFLWQGRFEIGLSCLIFGMVTAMMGMTLRHIGRGIEE